MATGLAVAVAGVAGGGEAQLESRRQCVAGAAERKLDLGADCWGRDVHDARMELIDCAERLPQIVRVDAQAEPILRGVGCIESLVKRADWDDRSRWSEDLLLRYAHAWLHIREDCRL